MAGKEDFMRQLRATFRVEAAEHLQAMAEGVDRLAGAADAQARAPLIETIFRAAHSLKGAARAADFADVENLCQSLETLFSSWKRGVSSPTPATLESARVSLDRMHEALGAPPPTAQPAAPAMESDLRAPLPAASTPMSAEGDTVRVSVRALDDRLLEAEELLTAKIAAAQRSEDLEELAPLFESWREHWSRVQPEASALRRANGSLIEFLEWNQEWLRAFESRVAALRRAAEQDRLNVAKLVDDLLANSKKMLMLPVGTLAPLLRKVVRDLARELGKDAELTIRGEETCVDKRILEEMKDPLVHLLRNSLDHGIESPAARAAAGKPARAAILIAVSRVNGNQVEILVSDDGAGVDVARVRGEAVSRGLISAMAAQSLDDEAASGLIFETDLSTSPMITQLSGRGLGLAIVREKAEKLGGKVSVESRGGAGTTLRMVLPLTLTTFRGVLVESGGRTFAVPTAQVERVTRFRASDVQTVEGRETIAHNGRALALAHLADVLELPAGPASNDSARPALILGSGNERIAFVVDAVLDEREVLVKRLRKPLEKIRNIAGATVLGSGQVAPILDVADLIKSARRAPLRRAAAANPPATLSASVTTTRVLVAEDSITSRMLLKGILESAGYFVKTAVDGLEAFTLLRSEDFDVLVSDVEMPRLNGFDLTARVRADRQLAELPVVLVTALASREDRERGIEVGANAYLVKGDLDQSNLLEALRRLA
ncbi:MAG TPA: response regulator [Steroidobacteraceae bacterium]|nr:response regulator [Steroidobacteraceae bacterium]